MGILTRMRTFIDVVDAEGFSAASRKTGRSKALLSKHVRELEDSLGVLLLNRSTRQLSLTEAGHAYYLRAQEILHEINSLQDSITEAHANVRGRIKISAPHPFAEAPIGQSLIDFCVAYPDVNLDIHLDDRFVDLIEEGFDLAIRITKMDDSSLIARKLMEVHSIVCTSPALLAQIGEPAKPEDLRHLPCLIDRNNRSFNHWAFMNKDGSEFTIPVNGPIEVNSPRITCNAAAAGLGFARMPFFVAEPELESGKLKTVLNDYTVTGVGVYAVYPHRRYLPARIRLLVDYLAQWFRNYQISNPRL